ncbi:hypothetical protein [Opitutus terrae]|uniref:Uncharacterized protein n=1 Tax=Opitutus terrae (strain DSM 11246 / JCM 15787 / PB90-1) TaxID=452637 RepID=B1ZU94_OPITP|nr:hypothetical protein [Opitutus terrae]ACB76656.1 hypothetical protein Oter_3379 [Opitutus terrae PB90-1]
MIDGTAELGLKLPAPAVTPDEIEQLVAVLDRAAKEPTVTEPGRRKRPPGWLYAEEIAERMGMLADESLDQAVRWVRKIASAAAPAVVSFPGSPGYKLWQHCTVEEIDHCIEAFESQGRDMIKRAVLYRQAYHRRFRGARQDSTTPAAAPTLVP